MKTQSCMRVPAGAFLFLAALALPASVTATDPIGRGVIEMSGSLSFDRTVDKSETTTFDPQGHNPQPAEAVWSTTQVTGNPAIGWFATDHLELAARFVLRRTWTNFEVGGEERQDYVDWAFGTTGLAIWNFAGIPPVVPYLGAGGGVLFTKEKERTTMVLPHLQGGLRFFFGDSVSLNTGFFYEMRWNDGVLYSVEEQDTWEFGVLFGMSVFR